MDDGVVVVGWGDGMEGLVVHGAGCAEPVFEPGLHLLNFLALAGGDLLGEGADGFVLNEILAEELLRHHDGSHVVHDHAVEKGAIECVALKLGEVAHHGAIVCLGGLSGIPFAEPLLHLLNFCGLDADNVLGKLFHFRTIAALQHSFGGVDRFLVVRDHFGQIIPFAADLHIVHHLPMIVSCLGLHRHGMTCGIDLLGLSLSGGGTAHQSGDRSCGDQNESRSHNSSFNF